MFLDFFFFLSLHWPRKVYSEFFFFFHFDPLGYKGDTSPFSQIEGKRSKLLTPVWLSFPAPFLAWVLSQELVIASITLLRVIFHKGCDPGHSPLQQRLCSEKPAQEFSPRRKLFSPQGHNFISAV